MSVQLIAALREEIDRKHQAALAALATLSGYLGEPSTVAVPANPPSPPVKEGEDEDDHILATDPIGKRDCSRIGLIPYRCERLLLLLNQLGPLTKPEIVEHLKLSQCQTYYILGRSAIVSVGGKYGACRVSDVWDEQDTAMFGEPKISTGSPYGTEARRMQPKADEPNGSDAAEDDHEEKPIEEEPAEEEPAEEEAAEESDGTSIDERRENADQFKPIVEKTEKWLRSEEHPRYKACQLCDSKFHKELICVANDHHGTAVMCRPCARRAGHFPPSVL
jgi:hypothetical protein